MEHRVSFIISVIFFCGITTQDFDEDAENFEYPCESTDDWDCIRDFLASTGQCEKTSHEDGVPLDSEDQHSYVPKLNVSIVSTESKVTYFGSKILHFYLNKDTNNLVMTLDFDAVTLDSPRSYFKFDRVGREPLVVEDFVNITYAPTITVIIAWSDHIAFDDLKASGFLKEPFPKMVLGPKITNSSNGTVQKTYAGLLADIPTATQELWLTKAYYYTCIFLNHMLCDFGYVYDGRVNRA